MFKTILADGRNTLKKDPATKTLFEAIFFSPGVKVMIYHRIAHHFYQRGNFLLARFFSHRGRKRTGIEIHPGATIEAGFFVDHGMGVVIGETAVVRENVTIFHGVTLGGIGGVEKKKRHPTIEAGVLIGAGAKILGDVTIGEGARIGANAVVLKDVPPYHTAVGVPANVVRTSSDAYLYVI
ncbi:serine O-acetyltransferase EpsC [Enterococcus sp. LJL98]